VLVGIAMRLTAFYIAGMPIQPTHPGKFFNSSPFILSSSWFRHSFTGLLIIGGFIVGIEAGCRLRNVWEPLLTGRPAP
jgi:hypothetical protein